MRFFRYLQPRLGWVEGPRTGLLKDTECVQGLVYTEQYCCQFSDWGYQKPTRIWGDPAIKAI